MHSKKSTTTENVMALPTKVGAVVLVAGNANASVALDDSLTGSGTERVGLKAIANESKSAFFGEKGLEFSVGVYSTLSGTGAAVYVYYV